MTTKKCSYKGCNTIRGKGIESQYTVHQFPKDPDRYREWMALSQCDENIPVHLRYLCSKHFDTTKYVAPNPRRTILLGTAVPYKYEHSKDEDEVYEGDQTSITDCEEFQQCVVSTLEDDHEDGDLAFYNDEVENEENTADSDDNVHISTFSLIEEPINTLNHTTDVSTVDVTRDEDITSTEAIVYDENVQENSKRKIDRRENNFLSLKVKRVQQQSLLQQHLPMSYQNRTCPNMQLKILSRGFPKTSQTIKKEYLGNSNLMVGGKEEEACLMSNIEEEEFNEDQLIQSIRVSTFIFKGEEYIQMPKADYINEKMLLLNKIKNYERILGVIKNSVDNLHLSTLN